jgi:hypothetical protein
MSMFRGERTMIYAVFVSKGLLHRIYALLSHHSNSNDENVDYANEHSGTETQNDVEA